MKVTLRLWSVLGLLVAAAGPGLTAAWQPTSGGSLQHHSRPVRLKADTNGNKLFDALEVTLTATQRNEPIPVIVRLRPGHEAAAAEIAGGTSRLLPGDRSVATRLTRQEIQRLTASSAVESIEENLFCYAARESSQSNSGVTQARTDFRLDGGGDPDPHRYSGRDVTIAVLDTGIDPAHPDFAGGKVIAWKDFVNGRPQPYDDTGHGTHVASIAAGREVDGVGGVAPAASLVVLKVLDANEEGRMDVMVDAMWWCLLNRRQYGIDIINLSFATRRSSNGTEALCRMVDLANRVGLVVCAAAGNKGPDNYTIGCPGSAEPAITVGNMIDPGQGGFALFPASSRGPTADGRIKPDLCAPGTRIMAAAANVDAYVPRTGTSMACPFVAGVAALMLQANPNLAPEDVKTILKETAVHYGPAGDNNDYGAGRLDAYAALARAVEYTATPPPVPGHLYGEGWLAGKDASQIWTLPIRDTRFPIAVTLLLSDTSTDFDLNLYDPAGRLVAVAGGAERQETVLFLPEAAGTYTLEVVSYAGAGGYSLDVSAGLVPPVGAR